jgi:hypothetical protein
MKKHSLGVLNDPGKFGDCSFAAAHSSFSRISALSRTRSAHGTRFSFVQNLKNTTMRQKMLIPPE